MFKSKYIYFRKSFLLSFLPIVIIFMFFHVYIYMGKRKHIINTLKNSKKHEITMQTNIINKQFEWIFSDLAYISKLYQNTSSSGESGFNRLKKILLLFSMNRKIYDQIRLIGLNGQELIRINNNYGMPFSVPNKQLQNKKHRYYFSKCLNLKSGYSYMSPMDLNIENKIIERPFRPMIRICTPAINDSGFKEGIIIFNYHGKHIINKIKESVTDASEYNGEFMVVNPQGHFLVSPKENDRWGFMFDDKKERTFQLNYPDEWEIISTDERGDIYNSKGLFFYSTINKLSFTFSENNKFYWKLIHFLPAKNINKSLIIENLFFIIIAIFIIVSTFVFSLVISAFYGNKLKYEHDLEIMAATDPLTGLLNRRSFLNKLKDETDRIHRHGGEMTIIIGDIDHFKKINDTYGHAVGDYILKRISSILNDNLRKTDSLCRWGGEEFIILQYGINTIGSVQTAEKLRQLVESESFVINEIEIKATICFGISTFREKMEIDDLIKEADEELYKSKKSGRNMVSVKKISDL